MMIHGGDGGYGAGEKGTGVAVLTTRVVPRCHGRKGRLEDWKGGGEEEGGRWGGRFAGFFFSPLLPPVTFKFRGSGTGSRAAPAGNVTPSDVSGQAKYNPVSTWKDVL